MAAADKVRALVNRGKSLNAPYIRDGVRWTIHECDEVPYGKDIALRLVVSAQPNPNGVLIFNRKEFVVVNPPLHVPDAVVANPNHTPANPRSRSTVQTFRQDVKEALEQILAAQLP